MSAWLFRLNDEPSGPFPETGLSDVADTPFEQEIEWMVHELRVSLFAQHLGAQGPVSEKRIRSALANLNT